MTHLDERVCVGSPSLSTETGAVAPVSFTQRRFWFMDQLEGASSAYNIPVVLHLRGPLQRAALAGALDAILKRHAVLRTRFAVEDGQPVQVVHPHASCELATDDLTRLPADQRACETTSRLEAAALRPFDLGRAPLVRARLLCLTETEHVLIVVMHHSIGDAWSVGILLRELSALYNGLAAGESPPLPPLTIQYAEYAKWQRVYLQGTTLRQQLNYWTTLLTGAPVLEFPTDQPREAAVGREAGQEIVGVSKVLTASLRAIGRSERATLFMTLMAAVKILLARWTGQEDLVVGFPVAGRTRPEFEPLIGCFLNTLPLRTDLRGDPTFRDLLARVRDGALDAYDNQELPFELLVEELNPPRILTRHPVFDVLLNYTPARRPVELDGLTVTRWTLPEPEAKYLLTLYATEENDALALSLVYQRDLLAGERMVAFAGQLSHLLAQIAAAPDARISAYSLITPSCRAVLPDPAAPLAEPHYDTVPVLLQEQAARTPHAVAVRQGSHIWTYDTVAHSARSIAGALRSRGLRPGDVVAVLGGRSFGLIGSFVGVLAAGGVLFPLDSTLPLARQRVLLREARTKYLLQIGSERTGDALFADFPAHARLVVDAAQGLPDAEPVESMPTAPPSGDQAAYVFFTSGTSGVPKAVLGCHKGLSHFLAWQRDTFGIGPADRVAQLTALSFDAMLRDVFLPLTSGGSICLPDRADRVEPEYVLPWLARAGVTVLHTVPALAESWLAAAVGPAAVPSLRYVFFSGEPLMDTLVNRWRSLVSPHGVVVNLYGPTETTLVKCWYRVPAHPAAGIQPIGRPMPFTQALVVADRWRMCGIEEPGEIVLRTPFRTLGYLNAGEEQRHRFPPNPFTGDGRDLLYRTGDSGRYEPDGSLVITGRLDDQVKIRGCRVEPAEITAALRTCPGVRDGVVVAVDDEAGNRTLVGYVVGNGGGTPSSHDLRRFLMERLPDYMIPSMFVPLAALPLTATGKVDRRALPTPAPAASAPPETHVGPRTALEKVLARIWADVLGHDRIGMYDGFFELGGHSLMATRLVARIRSTLGVEIPLRAVFSRPTIAELADLISERTAPPVTADRRCGE
jgi:amino acid adenylation domain-containing protein